MHAWRIAVDTPAYVADDLSGTGARSTGGRWNRAGLPLVYSSESIALALVESLVQPSSSGLPFNRYLVRIDIPDALWTAREDILAAPPMGWDTKPAGKVSLDFGFAWQRSRRSLILVVPSVAVSEEGNILINPEHPDALGIKAVRLRRWLYHARFR